MPDHKPRPWEKVCAARVSDEFGERHVPGCPDCHGTGYVPMTTVEMLEALAALSGHVTHSVHLSFNPLRNSESGQWAASVYRGLRHSSVERYGPTPDDALRAALEAVHRA